MRDAGRSGAREPEPGRIHKGCSRPLPMGGIPGASGAPRAFRLQSGPNGPPRPRDLGATNIPT
jgi:hypothetical protein